MSLLNIEVYCTDLDPTLKPESETELICSVCLGASPGGGDYRDYVHEFNSNFTEFTLWLSVHDDWSDEVCDEVTGEAVDNYIYSLEARGVSNTAVTLKQAAEILMEAAWMEGRKS